MHVDQISHDQNMTQPEFFQHTSDPNKNLGYAGCPKFNSNPTTPNLCAKIQTGFGFKLLD